MLLWFTLIMKSSSMCRLPTFDAYWTIVIAFLLLLQSPSTSSFHLIASRTVSRIRCAQLTAMTAESVMTIRPVNSRELSRCALLLAQNMYPAEIPRGQANELTRLELKDLESRYGDLVGKRKYPSVLLVAEEDQEFLGAVGLDCQYFDEEEQKFKMFKPSRADEDKGQREIVVVLANLTVRRDRRKKGIAKHLMQAAEQFVRSDIAPTGVVPAIYLLVESENIAAQSLYKKLGYKLNFVDEAATCVVSGDYNLKTQECVNYCFKKSLSGSSSAGGGGGAASLGGFFNSLFGKK